MSDTEEPPSKLSKMEMDAEFLEESFEGSQEEWLTEDPLTDDDQIEQKTSINSDKQKKEIKKTSKEPNVDSNLENTLNSLDSTNEELKLKKEEESKEMLEKDSDATDAGTDDGNDTDGLLRMLQEGNKKKKIVSKQKEKKQIDNESSDDSDVYEKTRVTRSKARAQRQAMKAVPEPSDSDESQDEAATVQKMFKVRNVASKSTARPLITDQQRQAIQTYIERRERMNASTQKMNAQKNARLAKTTPKPITPPSKPNIAAKTSPINKNSPKTSVATGTKDKIANVPIKVLEKPKANTTVNPLQGARSGPMSKEKKKGEEVRDEPMSKEKEEVRDEDDDDDGDGDGLNDELASNPDMAIKQADKQKLHIMEPERMDEEVPTDDDSDDEGSYYDDEMPTSDSDDLEDWFTLDLRSERAGEYIPMLGENARSILTEEKRRVGNRLDELRKSVTALSDSAKQQADQIRDATNTLNELEALIKAT